VRSTYAKLNRANKRWELKLRYA